MPGQPIPSELKEKGLIWLLPPYCWSHRQIARKLKDQCLSCIKMEM